MRTVSRWITAGGCVLLLALAAQAGVPRDQVLANTGRTAYDQGQFEVAAQAFQELLGMGLDNAAVHYDLANAEFKAGHVGLAVYHYRLALKASPNDEDIRYNLNYLRRQLQSQPDNGPLERLLQELYERVPGSGLLLAAWTLLLLFCFSGALWIRGHYQPGLWRTSTWVLGLLFLLCGGGAFAHTAVEQQFRYGVVVVGQAEARNGPGADYPVGFTVPEGREVRVLGHEGEWVAIGLTREGYKGWVRSNEVLAEP